MTAPKVISKSSSLLFIIVPTSHKEKIVYASLVRLQQTSYTTKQARTLLRRTLHETGDNLGFSAVAFFSYDNNTRAKCVNHFIRPEIIHPMRLLEGNYRSHRASLAITFHNNFLCSPARLHSRILLRCFPCRRSLKSFFELDEIPLEAKVKLESCSLRKLQVQCSNPLRKLFIFI